MLHFPYTPPLEEGEFINTTLLSSEELYASLFHIDHVQGLSLLRTYQERKNYHRQNMSDRKKDCVEKLISLGASIFESEDENIRERLAEQQRDLVNAEHVRQSACLRDISRRIAEARRLEGVLGKCGDIRLEKEGKTHLRLKHLAPPAWRDLHPLVRYLYAIYAACLSRNAFKITVRVHPDDAARLGRSSAGFSAQRMVDEAARKIHREMAKLGFKGAVTHLALVAECVSKDGMIVTGATDPHLHGIVLLHHEEQAAFREALRALAGPHAAASSVELLDFDPHEPERWAFYVAPGFFETVRFEIVTERSGLYLTRSMTRDAQMLYDADRRVFMSIRKKPKGSSCSSATRPAPRRIYSYANMRGRW